MAANRRLKTTATVSRWDELGRRLRIRREEELGYPFRPEFEEATGLNHRLMSDIENNPPGRANTYLNSTLKNMIAPAYQVTYRSIIAFLKEEADELTPADGPAPAAPGPSALPPPPDSGLIREEADRPYATPVWAAVWYLYGRGVLDPDGAQIVAAVTELIQQGLLDGGTLPLSEKDAQAWDSTAGAMVMSDRVWAVSDLRRRREAFSAERHQGASSA